MAISRIPCSKGEEGNVSLCLPWSEGEGGPAEQTRRRREPQAMWGGGQVICRWWWLVALLIDQGAPKVA